MKFSSTCKDDVHLARSAQRSELAAVMRRVEVAVGMGQAVCNRSRLLKFAADLSARLGSAAMGSPLAKLLLHKAALVEIWSQNT